MRSPLLRVDIHIYVFVFLCNVLLSRQAYRDTNKAILFKWKVPEYEYPNEEYKNEAIREGKLIPQNVLIMEADYFAPAGRYFVTTPLFRAGIPSSLSEVVGQEGLLRPFPYWPQYDESGKSLSCDGPFSVFRVIIDKCNQMWALDSGLNYANASPLSCPPKLLVYDLDNGDREVFRYTFSKGNYTEFSTLTTFVIESYERDCSDSILYITDERFHGLVVFDYAQKTSWRVEDPTHYPYPEHHLFTINGITFSVMAGLFGIALGPEELDRKLYFHSFASVKESWTPVAVLKNRTLAAFPNITGPATITSPGERSAQSTVEVMTDDGILIYHVVTENSIVCWNTRTPFTIENQYTLARDDDNFQYIGGLKLKDNNLLITSCRYQNYLYGLEDTTQFNYRIIVIEDVKRLLANTPCANYNSNADSYQLNTINTGRGFPLSSAVSYSYDASGYVGEPSRAVSQSQFSTAGYVGQPSGAVSGSQFSTVGYFGAPVSSAVSESQFSTPGYGGEPSRVGSQSQFSTAGQYEKSIDSVSYQSYPQRGYVHGFEFVGSQSPYNNGNSWYLKTLNVK